MPEPAPRKVFDLYVAVAVGGAIGAVCRNALEHLIPTATGGWPTATFIVNITGAFVLGVVLAIAVAKFPDPTANNVARRFRPFVITGVLGGYTTFSTYMMETHSLLSENEVVLAGTYLIGSVVAGVATCLAGLAVGGALLARRGGEPAAVETAREAAQDVVDEEEA